MEYIVIKNNSKDFWEEAKSNSFGIVDKLTIKLVDDLLIVESHGEDVFLYRDNKKAKISSNDKIIKGKIENKDKIFFGDETVIEFVSLQKKPPLNIKMPHINWNLWLGVIVLLLIFVTIFFGWKKNSEDSVEKEYQKISGEIRDNLNKFDEVKSIDPETGLKLLNEAKSKIDLIKKNEKHTQETVELEDKIVKNLSVSGSSDVVGFEEVYNTKVADAVDRNYDKMAVFGNYALLTETKTKKVVLLNLESKKVEKFELNKDIGAIVDTVLVNKNIYIYDGRTIVDIQNAKISSVSDEVFLKAINWNNSWYLLGQDGKISKVVDSKISNWTIDNQNLVGKPMDMAIDGTVWVIDETGNVKNYEKGVEKKWNPSTPFTGSGSKIIGITTTLDSTKIAIISDKKVFVFEKGSGKLIATHNFEKIGIIQAKMGSDSQIYVLGADSKIYKVK